MKIACKTISFTFSNILFQKSRCKARSTSTPDAIDYSDMLSQLKVHLSYKLDALKDYFSDNFKKSAKHLIFSPFQQLNTIRR